MESNNKTKNTERKCRVIKRMVTMDEATKLLESQRKNVTPNQRDGEESAFEKALKGSQRYLKHKGLIE